MSSFTTEGFFLDVVFLVSSDFLIVPILLGSYNNAEELAGTYFLKLAPEVDCILPLDVAKF